MSVRALSDLERSSHAMAQHLYKSTQGGPEGGPTAAGPQASPDGTTAGADKNKEDVIDAEYEVKK